MLDLTIVNGSVVFPGVGVQNVDIGVRQGVIAGLYNTGGAPEAKETIDASGLTVMPGVVDPHVHMGIYQPLAEDFERDSKAAALGGVTSTVNYYRHADTYLDTMEDIIDQASEVSIIDFGFSLGLLREKHVDEFEEVAKGFGISSWKFYRNYEWVVGERFGIDDPLNLDDADFLASLELMQRVSDKLLLCVHCEDMDIQRARMREMQKGEVEDTLAQFAQTSPGYAETISLLQTLYLTRLAGGGNVYIVHLSAGESVGLLAEFPELVDETGVTVETTPHYLNLTENAPCGLLAKVGPPIHAEEDQNRLWEGIAEGIITSMGSDHVPNFYEKKTEAGEDLWSVKYGFGSIGVEFPLIISEGYHSRGLPLETIASLMSQQPARSFGLYPKKGAIQLGSDADLVLVDLEKEQQITTDLPHVACDYSVYEGVQPQGWPVVTLSRGEVIAKDGEVLAEKGRGEYLPREL